MKGGRMNQILGTYLHKTMKGQLGLIININFHRLKGTNVTVNHIRELPQANGIQYEMNYGCTSPELRFWSICLASSQILTQSQQVLFSLKNKIFITRQTLHPQQGNAQPFLLLPLQAHTHGLNKKQLKKLSQNKNQLTQIHYFKYLTIANL